MKFTELNLNEELISGLNDLNFLEPTPIQEKAIPLVLEGKDVLGTAQTGTGKTGAFVIPIVDRVLRGKRDGIKVVILTPTRELAQQIDEQIFAIGYHTGITSATVIGGSDFSAQAKALKAGVDIIVATPGRFIDQNKIVNIDFSTVDYLILDEADRMLDMGFLPDISKIISWMPKSRQTLLFSATMPKEIEKLASSIMKDPERVEISRSKPSQSVEQRAYLLRSNQKIPLVKHIFDTIEWESCIIFTSTKKGTDELQRLLKKQGIKAGSIHGDRSQDERNKALNAFKSGEIPVIVATNVIARGIDIKDISLIINYDVPRSSDDYVHRIGRTGRYDKSGIAVTFVTRRDSKAFQEIDSIKGNQIKKIRLPDSFDESTEFYWDKKPESAGRSSESKSTSKTSSKSSSRSSESKKRGGSRSSRSSGKSSARSSGSRDSDTSRQSSPKPSKRTPSASKQAEPSRKGRRDDRNGKSEVENTDDRKRVESRVKEKKGAGRTKQAAPAGPEMEVAAGQSDDVKEEIRSSSTHRFNRRESRPPIVEKARERNKRARKPSKGIWGLIKSVIPRFKRD